MASNSSVPEPEGIGNAEPTPQEIIVPPFTLLFGAFTAILLLWMCTHCLRKYHYGLRSGLVRPTKTPKFACMNTNTLKKLLNFKGSQQHRTPLPTIPIQNNRSFLSERDLRMLDKFRCFQNSANELFWISFPASLTLCFCPLTLFLYQPLVKAFWPSDMFAVAPNINESIACFLAPAGMVYAVSFGFAFQQVLAKQTDVMKNIAHDVRQMNQLISMTKSLRCISLKTRIKMYGVLKTEILTMMSLFMQSDTNGGDKEEQEDIWCIVDLLREAKSPSGDNMDDAICGRFIKYLGCLRNISRDNLHSKMHFLEWALLETLGYFTFLGILMVQAQSYRLELTMCIITVLSITMLCYIVADLDNPFHGFFRIDLSQIEALIKRLQRMYVTAISTDNAKEEVKHNPGNTANDVKKKRRLSEHISFFGNVCS